MVLLNSLLRADIAEDTQLLFVFSAHAFFLSGSVVETRELSGTEEAYSEIRTPSSAFEPSMTNPLTLKAS
jgi:hypothetical protein